VFAGRLPSGVSIIDVVRWADEMADANDATERRTVLRDLFARLSALEAQYVVRLLGGELQIGVDEALIEEALATAFSQPLDAVRRAAALRGDIGEVAALARRRMLTPLSAAV
jgi:DNA ligase-1